MSQQPDPQQPGPQGPHQQVPYQQGPHQQVPGQLPDPPQPPAPARKKWYKRPVTWIVAVIAVIAFAVNGGGDSDEASEPATEPAAVEVVDAAEPADQTVAETDAVAEAEPEPVMAAMGESVTVGDVTYVVTDVEYGVSQLGDEYVNTTPQGQFVVVSLDLTNNGTEALSFSDEMVVLLDGEIEYSASADAWAYLEESVLYEEVNPGNTLSAQVAFDVPADAHPSVAQLSEGFWGTNTVDVALS